jgi:DME family drug/metabolite transporter
LRLLTPQRAGTIRRAASTRGYWLVASAAVLWGTLGIFFKSIIGGWGLTPLTLAFFRAALSCLFLGTSLILVDPTALRIQRSDLPFFAAFGLVSVAIFYTVYITAVDLTTVATAAVLLYTAPAFVTLFAWWLYDEPLDRRKLAALAMTFAGCALVARAYDLSQLRVNALGVLCGLAAGLTYALYSIFGKHALRAYRPTTIVTYAMGFGALCLLPFQSASSLLPAATPSALWIWLAALALGPTIGSVTLYTAGLRYIQASVASIIATLEPATATLLSFVLLHEQFTPGQALGGGLILGGVLLLSARPRLEG